MLTESSPRAVWKAPVSNLKLGAGSPERLGQRLAGSTTWPSESACRSPWALRLWRYSPSGIPTPKAEATAWMSSEVVPADLT